MCQVWGKTIFSIELRRVLLTAVYLLIAEFCPPEQNEHQLSVFQADKDFPARRPETKGACRVSNAKY